MTTKGKSGNIDFCKISNIYKCVEYKFQIFDFKLPWPYFPVLLPTPLKLNFIVLIQFSLKDFSKVVTTLLCY